MLSSIVKLCLESTNNRVATEYIQIILYIKSTFRYIFMIVQIRRSFARITVQAAKLNYHICGIIGSLCWPFGETSPFGLNLKFDKYYNKQAPSLCIRFS